jgi:hypothetical protein
MLVTVALFKEVVPFASDVFLTCLTNGRQKVIEVVLDVAMANCLTEVRI